MLVMDCCHVIFANHVFLLYIMVTIFNWLVLVVAQCYICICKLHFSLTLIDWWSCMHLYMLLDLCL